MSSNAAFTCALLALQIGVTSLLRGASPLPGQIIVDPQNASHLVYNRDADGDGRLDPCYLIGPGDPEGFLFLGERQPDGTRRGGRQLGIIDQMRRHGGNVIYFQAVRSHGGDGADDHNPWRDSRNPGSGLDPAVIQQWRGWFDQLRDAGIAILFFVYDDGAHPFGDGCDAEPSPAEQAFVRDLVNAFEDYPNLIWVVQEEFYYVGPAGNRQPCDAARLARTGRIADLIKQADDYNHPVGVHHNTGFPMAFAGHPSVDVFLQQPSTEPKKGRGTLEVLHAAGGAGVGFDPQHRYVYFMAEAFDWHAVLCHRGDREMLRKSYYATALAGGHVAVLGMYPTELGRDPTDEMLQDMRAMQRFFESTELNALAPHDGLAWAGTRWMLANPARGRYILYTPDESPTLGVKRLPAGELELRWFDPATGRSSEEKRRHAGGDASFQKPRGIGAEAALYLRAR